MEDLSMFQRPKTVALEDENPGTYGVALVYPLNRLVECGFVGDTAINPWVGIFCRRQGSARESESLMRVLIYPLDRLVECGFAGYMLNIYTWELVALMGTHVISRSMA
ncbi:hypothetical protein PIB30_055974 [Stylosanthes scabra]|uniref:Uncharacterized protein n=1 Tax=Stylosanthes scabra TaxID=79078 RepID=A0ABU6TJ47_9FABA|nr:hypothetical protein [Stylosanthes scabra]